MPAIQFASIGLRGEILGDGSPFPFDKRTEATYADEWWKHREGVGQLAQVLFLKERDLMAMLAFYGDGSGEHGTHGSGPMIVAGYVGFTTDWFGLECGWVKALEEYPAIKYFKGSECVPERPDTPGRPSLKGEFDGWDRDVAAAKRLKLAEVFAKHGHRFIEVSSYVRWDEYHSIIGQGSVRGMFRYPYLLCFHGVASFVYGCSLYRDYRGKIPLVLDTGNPKGVEDEIQQQMSILETQDFGDGYKVERKGSITFADDRYFPMLQVADMLVWGIRADMEGLPSPILHVLRRNLAGRGARPLRPAGFANFVVDMEP